MDDSVLEYNILDTLDEHDGQVTQRHISARTGRSLAPVNFPLRLLAIKGFVKISGANPRNLRYHLTPRGLPQWRDLIKIQGENTQILEDIAFRHG